MSTKDEPAATVRSSDEPPAGFTQIVSRAPFSTHNGPFYRKAVDEGACHGFRVAHHHCNGLGIAHGGMLIGFADGLLGAAVLQSTNGRALTLRLGGDYLSMARQGEWVEGYATLTHATRAVAFAEGTLSVGRRPIMAVSGVFKLMNGPRVRAERGLVGRKTAGKP